MARQTNPKDSPVEQIADELKEGLESCRAVVSDYRAKLAGRDGTADTNGEPGSDEAPPL